MKNKLSSKLIIALSLLFVGLISAGSTFYYNTANTDRKAKEVLGATIDKNNEKKDTISNLKKILLIDGETKDPAIATVVDPEKVKKSNPDFYKNVEKDDTLIVYPNRAIIYRDAKNQIINIAPIVNPSNADGVKIDAPTEVKIPVIDTKPKN
jgi:hypothetical protein